MTDQVPLAKRAAGHVVTAGWACGVILGVIAGQTFRYDVDVAGVLAFVAGVALLAAGVATLSRRSLSDPTEHPYLLAPISFLGALGYFLILFAGPTLGFTPDAEYALARTLGGIGLLVLWPLVVGRYVLRAVDGGLTTVAAWLFRTAPGERPASVAATSMDERTQARLWLAPLVAALLALASLILLWGGWTLLQAGRLGPGTTASFLGACSLLATGATVFARRRLPAPPERPWLLGPALFVLALACFVAFASAETVFPGPDARYRPLSEAGAVGVVFVWPLAVGQYVLRWAYRKAKRGLVGRVGDQGEKSA